MYLQKICIFCDKSEKYIKQSHTRESVIQARTLCADEKVRGVATAKMNNKILAITSRELVAAEAHYDKTCYRDYTKSYYTQSHDNSVTLTDDDQTYSYAEEHAYEMLFDKI